ncbi:MAG: iron-containing redox enzyme family protein [Woeseiaceae bacterium]|nr:iron-containing redox enzyme family protein [Woeseiaceae bacterium]
MTASAALRFKIGLGRSALADASRAFWTHPELGMRFPEYLFHLFSAMRASVSLITAARDTAADMAGEDPLAAGVVDYFALHAEEEREHANWLLDDMLALGADRAAISERTPPTTVAALIGTQYYWIHHVHPAVLLAYLVVLEGDPMPAEALENYASAAGIPAEGLRTLIYHAKTDVEHGRELFQLIDELPLTPAFEEKLGFNALQVIGQLAEVFRGLARKQV